MGKLLGNTAIALVVAALYLGCGYSLAVYQGYGDVDLSLAHGGLRGVSCGGRLAVWLALHGRRSGMHRTERRPDAHDAGDDVSMFPAFVWMAVLRIPRARFRSGWRFSRRPVRS